MLGLVASKLKPWSYFSNILINLGVVMGFSDLARSLIQNNNRLRRNLKEKYFRSRNRSKQNDLSAHVNRARSHKPKVQSNEERKYRFPLKKGGIITLSIIIILVIPSYLAFDRLVGIAYRKDKHEIESLIDQRLEQDRQEAYIHLVKEGDQYLAEGLLDESQKAYNLALNLFPSGKWANYGMANALMLQCRKQGKNCEESIAYQEQIISSGVFTEEELEVLEKIKTN